MLKKEKEQVLARHLRKKGKSLRDIAETLGVSKGSVSLWVKDIKLTKSQLRFLAYHPFKQEAIMKRVASRLKNEKAKRQIIIDLHKETIKHLNFSLNDLLAMGVCLYWAEGGKADSMRTFRFSNSDPEMIKVMMCFIREVCRISNSKIRGHICLHEHLDKDASLMYWSEISGIPASQFQKTSAQHNKASKNTKDTLPYGTVSIEVYSVDLYLKIMGWIEVVKDKILNKYGN
jgi:predicted transcriptional regulator